MFKKSLLSLMMLCFAFFGVARAQSELTVHDGTATNGYVPVYGWYADAYLKCEMVYPATELTEMTGGTISSLTFYASQANVDWGAARFQVFVDEVNGTTISDFAGPGTIVYEGALSISGNQMVVEFAMPYTYGGGNLLVGIYETTTGGYVTSTWYGETVDGASVQGYSYSGLDAITATQQNFLPKTTFTYIASGAVVCEKPATLEVTDITGFGATCTWESEVGNYTFEWKKASETEWNVVPNLTTTTYELNNLEPYTAYSVRVKAVCGTDLESGYKTANFTTLDVCPDGMVCIGEGTATNSYLPTYNYYNYSYTQQIYTADEIGDEAAAILSVDIYSVGSVTRNLEIYMVNTEKRSFADGNDWIIPTESDLVFSGSVTFAANSWNTMVFDNPFIFDGTNNVALIVRDITGSYVSSINFFVFDAESQAIRAYRDTPGAYDIAAPGVTGTVMNVKNRVRFAMGEPPACVKPTALAVNYEGNTEATVTWNSEATSFNISVNGEVTEDVSSPYILDELELSTQYEVMVQANCGGDGMSEWTNPVSFTTDDCMLADMTIVNYAFTDSYGDGWNGNYILVLDETCTIVDALTIENGSSASGTLKVCGSYIQFVWYMSGSNTYPGETSWVFTNAAGEVLFEGEGSSSMATGDVLYTIDNNPVKTPTNLEYAEVGPHSAKLSWTENGTATAWQIMIDEDEDNIIDANSNPFVVTGLEPETEYFMQVRAVGTEGTSIWTCIGVDFYTTEPCPAPTELNVTPYPYTANVTWNGWGESYDIEWAEMAEYEPSDDALWLVYDDGEWTNNVGNSTAYEWQWGVMYPADMLEGLTYLNKVAFYESSYFTSGEVVTFSIYSGGDDAPGTLIGTEEVTCTASDAIREITLSAPITIDPTQNLWITLTSTTLTYPMTMCAVDEANGRWVNNDGTWIDIGTALSSVASCSFMIRGLLDNISPEYVWHAEANVSSPYTITDLNPEAEYVVKVKANCGEDGESGWATTTFTTPSPCDAATDLTAEAEATSANLSWTGYQDSYNLKYWSPGHMNAFNEADFTQLGEDIMADSVLTTYNFDLSAFSGVGNIAIRHYNVTDQFRLNVDDIVVTNAQGEVVVNEDFESGEINLNWINYDNDGDGYVWGIWNITQQDAYGEDVGNGEYCATSASYNSAGALFPDNWLIIPNVELGGTLTFVARGQDPSYSDEIFGVFVSTNELYVPGTDPVTLEGVTNPYTLTGLDPETPYAWQVLGINAECDSIGWSEIAYFTTPEQTTLTQTIALSSATVNFCSFYVDITLADLQTALTDVLGTGNSVSITIKSQTQNCKLTRGRWTGQLTTLDLGKMYKILVNSDCEITLEGMLVDPTEHPVIINGNGLPTWIAFPFNAEMTLTDAFAGFAVNGDVAKSRLQNANYTRGRWTGQLSTLEPGQGYIYKSAPNAADRTFVYPTSAKAKVKAAPIAIQTPKTKVDASMEKKPRTIEIDFPRK